MKSNSNSYIDDKGNLFIFNCPHKNKYEAFSFSEERLMEVCKDCGEITRKV